MSLELKDQYDKIYNFCYFKVKNREVAEDLTQETILKYFKSTNYLECGKKLEYLYTIARNNCNDYFRKVPTEELNENSAITCNLSDVETTFAVKDEVSKLSLENQELILLRFTNELGISEIANFLGISRFIVYRRLNAVLKILKTKLVEEDFYE